MIRLCCNTSKQAYNIAESDFSAYNMFMFNDFCHSKLCN